MKFWLNDLKPGDRFWISEAYIAMQCELIGDAHNMNFRMPRYKCNILTEPYKGLETEFFVNQYVYDNPKEVYEEIIKSLNYSISEKTISIKSMQQNVDELTDILNNTKEIYDKLNNEPNT